MRLNKFIGMEKMTFLTCILYSWNAIGTPVTGANKVANQPNIILIYADDLGYADLGCQGSKDIRTPNIDELAKKGVRFTSGYVTAPQCAPSRAGLMTGLNQACFGYHDNSANRGLPGKDKAVTIAEYLKAQDYVTGIIGKWHIGDEINISKEIVEGSRPWKKGFDYTLMMNLGMSHYFPYREDGRNWMVSRNREPRLTEVQDGGKKIVMKDYPTDSYLTDIISTEAVNYIRRNKNLPFFLYVAYNAPHTPLVAKKEDFNSNSHVSDKQRRTFAAMMTALDRGVGEIVNVLEEQSLSAKTLVFFISDNGGPTSENTSRNDPFSGFKGDVLEGGIRVPFIACWPGVIPGGQIYDAPVTTLDVLPTAVALAGGKLSKKINYMGVNLLPFLTGEKKGVPHDWLIWRWRNLTALRKGEWKVVRPFDNLPQSGLYNLKENVKEIPETQIDDAEKLQKMGTELKNWNKKYVAE